MTDEEATRPAYRERFGTMLDRAESIYLRVLRAIILIIATLMIIYASWLTVSSLYKIAQSPESIQEKVAAVSADDLTDAEMPETDVGNVAAGDEPPTVNPAHQKFYASFVSQYYALFRSKFEPFRQADDKRLSKDEFDDSFVKSAERLKSVSDGELSFEEDKADLEALLAVMTEAADKPATQQRLQKYKAAKKVKVSRKVQRTRTEYRNGWDRYSTDCPGWFYEPTGCRTRRAVQVPYTQTVTSMEFPNDTQSHSQIFRAFQNRFYELLQERREANAAAAETERTSIQLGIVEGKLSLFTTLQVLGAFLVLMFFFLLIAIERHQRKISASMQD